MYLLCFAHAITFHCHHTIFPSHLAKNASFTRTQQTDLFITFISLILSRKSPPLLACFTAAIISKSCIKSVSMTLFYFNFLNCFNILMKIEFGLKGVWVQLDLGTTSLYVFYISGFHSFRWQRSLDISERKL